MSNHMDIIDDLVKTFEKEIIIPPTTTNADTSNSISNETQKTPTKSQLPSNNNDKIKSKEMESIKCNDTKSKEHINGIEISPTSPTNNNPSLNNNNNDNNNDNNNNNDDNNNNNEDDKESDEKEIDDLSEEEALKLALAMSMNDEDRLLLASIKKEIQESQEHLSNWFSGDFESVRHKNRAWCDFCKRLHHKFEMYRIENGIIQPLNYQFFIQFIAMMYGTMPKVNNNKNINKNNDNNNSDLHIDQHKIKKITLLSADDTAINYLRFKDNIDKNQLITAVYVKFESLALDPMAPNQWKWNHVMFIRSDKAPNGLLWTKWHMQ